jgi:hypothetical protein
MLLKEGAESDKKDLDDQLAIDTAPDAKVCYRIPGVKAAVADIVQIRNFILQSAEQEGIDVTSK